MLFGDDIERERGSEEGAEVDCCGVEGARGVEGADVVAERGEGVVAQRVDDCQLVEGGALLGARPRRPPVVHRRGVRPVQRGPGADLAVVARQVPQRDEGALAEGQHARTGVSSNRGSENGRRRSSISR